MQEEVKCLLALSYISQPLIQIWVQPLFVKKKFKCFVDLVVTYERLETCVCEW